MKTVQIVPGTKMAKRIRKLEQGDQSQITKITEEATALMQSEGYTGAVAVVIADAPDEVPSRVVNL
jgi:hypothetical protein